MAHSLREIKLQNFVCLFHGLYKGSSLISYLALVRMRLLSRYFGRLFPRKVNERSRNVLELCYSCFITQISVHRLHG